MLDQKLSDRPRAVRHRRRSSAVGEHHKRLDIQGLRTVAVVLVILDHLFGWPHGGFIGVDVFFVISGFLITGNLLRQQSHVHGPRGVGIVMLDFYRKRIKRIMPAAVLVLAVTVIAAELLFTGTRAADTRVAAFWALLFGANIHFSNLGTDYFGATAAISPVQHYWSLSVEEQFYFVWPILMLGIFAILAKLGRHRAGRAVSAVAMAALIGASFWYAVQLTNANATEAYFSSLGRAWELGVGALLAIIAPAFRKTPYWLGSIAAWAGLMTIFGGALFVSGENGFPAPAAMVPVLGSALVIAGGIAHQQRHLWLLTNRVSEYLGDISYSLYLWHFPAIVFLSVLLPSGSALYYSVTLISTLLVAAVAYEAVENPLRQASWSLRGGASARAPRPIPMGWGGASRAQIVSLAALLAITVVFVGLALKPSPTVTPVDLTAAERQLLSQTDEERDATPEDVVAQEVLQALQAPTWPENLSPSMDEAGDDDAPEFSDGCMYPDLSDRSVCTYGTGSRLAVVVGDSIGVSWMPGVREALGKPWTVRDIGFGSCAFVDADRELSDPTAERQCNENRAGVVALINDLDPEMVILTNNQGGLASLPGDLEGDELLQQWASARASAIESISADGRDVVILTPPPMGAAPDECAGALSSPADCVSGIGREWKEMLQGDIFAAEQTGARVIDAQAWFCSASEQCPIFVGTTPVRTDELHLTASYSRQLAPVLRWALIDRVATG